MEQFTCCIREHFVIDSGDISWFAMYKPFYSHHEPHRNVFLIKCIAYSQLYNLCHVPMISNFWEILTFSFSVQITLVLKFTAWISASCKIGVDQHEKNNSLLVILVVNLIRSDNYSSHIVDRKYVLKCHILSNVW